MKVILNKCYGGFGVSDAAYELYAQKKGIKLYRYVSDGRTLRKSSEDGLLSYWLKKDHGTFPERDLNWDDVLSLDERYREDPTLVEAVEELGSAANGIYARLVVVDIPDGMDYVIDEYDGIETLHEKVKVW